MRILDGEYVEVRDDSLQISRAVALTASGGPMFPPADWFSNPEFDRPMPITVTADGRIHGHIAAWRTDHIGMPTNTRPPRSATDYAYFKTGVLRTDDGNDVQVGQLTLAGGHAPITAGADEAVKHYDDTSSSVADISVGEDEHGIWISGGVRPGVTDAQIRALRASAPSGDWRPIEVAPGMRSLELVAVCQVNTPGFPIARAMVASGEVTALVAAGAGYMFGLQQELHVYQELARQTSQIEELESLVAGLLGKKKDEDKEPEDDESDEPEKESDAPHGDEDTEQERMRMRKIHRDRARRKK